jgi:hypothetical protein
MSALCAAAPIAAQSAPSPQTAQPPAVAPADAPPGGNEIVVTGRAGKPTAGEVFDQARGISRVGRHDLYEEALPRFWSPVCPGVSGLKTAFAEAMVGRMRDNLARLKVPLARGRCSPNLVVAFADDGRSLLADLQRDRPALFQRVSDAEKAEILGDEAPVHVWTNIARRWTGAGAPPRDEAKASVWGQLDRTTMPWSYDIVGALVVFDRSAVTGLTLDQLADYATIRGLSHTRAASGAAPMATILSLFDANGASPGELTDFDTGYLRSLYSSRPSASAAHKLLDVRRWAEKASREAAPAKP